MNQKLKNHLKELHQELERINSDDPKLRKLSKDIQDALSQPDEIPHTLNPSLQHMAEEFEVRHPKLTALINNVMLSLSGLGI